MRKLFHIHLLLLSILTISISSPEKASAQEYMARDGYVEFVSQAPLLEFKGTSNYLNGLLDLEDNLVDFYIDLNTLDTGIELRNRHMRDRYLNTDRCPFAEFTGNLESDFDPDRMEPQEAVVVGTFKVNCIENDIRVQGTLEPTDEGIKLEASFQVLLKDYDIERPGVIFYELAEEQVINISILLDDESTNQS